MSKGRIRELRTRNRVAYDEQDEELFEWVEEEEVPENLDNVGAEEAVLSPHVMSDFEKKNFANHAKHPGKRASFLTIRNHILTQWHNSRKTSLLDRDKAIAQVKRTERETGRLVYDFLERFGFINFGALPRPLPPPGEEHERIIIIGAGMSGIAAASQLHQLGYRVILLEARDRVGGRIHTDRSFRSPVDLGASVVTGTRGNPVWTVIEQLNLKVHKITENSTIRDVRGKELPSDVDAAIEKRFNACLEKANKAKGPANVDKSLGEMLQEAIVQEAPTLEEAQLLNWHVANLEYACASDLARVSLNDWDQDDGYEFEGDHLLLPQGYDVIPEQVAKLSNLDIRFKKVVRSITYRKNGVKIVTEDRELFSAKHVLITLPLGVLKNRDVEFNPPLPEWKESAINKLGFGVLNKIAIQFPKAFWESKADYFAQAREDPHKRGEFFLFWDMQKCMNTSTLIGLIAGRAAYDIEQDPKEEVFKRAMASLEKMIGPVPTPEKYVVTSWASDPYARGSYSYIAVGATGADYDALAKPIGHKLFFAGEATDRYHPATVGGAFVSGLRAAGAIDKVIGISRDLRAKLKTSADISDSSLDSPTVKREDSFYCTATTTTTTSSSTSTATSSPSSSSSSPSSSSSSSISPLKTQPASPSPTKSAHPQTSPTSPSKRPRKS